MRITFYPSEREGKPGLKLEFREFKIKKAPHCRHLTGKE
jgi:hypothetical protein